MTKNWLYALAIACAAHAVSAEPSPSASASPTPGPQASVTPSVSTMPSPAPETQAQDSSGVVRNVFTYYYFDKSPDVIPQVLKWLQEQDAFEKNPQAYPHIPIEAFFGTVFAENAPQVADWLKVTSFTGQTKLVLERSLWLAGAGDKIADLFGETPDFAKAPPPDLKTLTIVNPARIDAAWGAFIASGDPVYVKRILASLDSKHPLGNDKQKDAETRKAAASTLGENIIKHEKVLRIVKQEMPKSPPAVKAALKKILADYESQVKAHALPLHDGEFSAMAIVIDPKAAAEQAQKPAEQAAHFTVEKTAHFGDKRSILLVFQGMGLSADYRGDVTYSLKIVDPAGHAIFDSAGKDLVAFQTRTPTRFRIFNAASGSTLEFAPTDTLGEYNFSGVIKDNIAQKKIPFSGKIELVK